MARELQRRSVYINSSYLIASFCKKERIRSDAAAKIEDTSKATRGRMVVHEGVERVPVRGTSGARMPLHQLPYVGVRGSIELHNFGGRRWILTAPCIGQLLSLIHI